MSDTEKIHISRQARNGEKKPVMVYLPADLRSYLEARKDETGLSLSAYIVVLIRREKFHVET